MTKKQLLRLLTDLGLSEPEACIYLASLSLGSSTIMKLASEANIKRTTAYSLIEHLQRKGLMRTELRGFKKKFAAASPDTLESMLDQQRQKLHHALPDLQALYTMESGESVIRQYEGLEATKGIYEQLLKDVRPHDDYLILSNPELTFKIATDFFQDFIQRRAKLDIKIRMLAQDSPFARERQRFQKNHNEIIKILPPGTKLSTNLVIIPKYVVIHQMVPPIFAIVIENKNVIQMHREQFEIMWKSIPDQR